MLSCKKELKRDRPGGRAAGTAEHEKRTPEVPNDSFINHLLKIFK